MHEAREAREAEEVATRAEREAEQLAARAARAECDAEELAAKEDMFTIPGLPSAGRTGDSQAREAPPQGDFMTLTTMSNESNPGAAFDREAVGASAAGETVDRQAYESGNYDAEATDLRVSLRTLETEGKIGFPTSQSPRVVLVWDWYWSV